MSMCCLSTVTDGQPFAIASARSSPHGMLIAMPFDLVAPVRCLRACDWASSKVYFLTRSMLWREKTDSGITISRSVPS
jgi:hypothetical protein